MEQAEVPYYFPAGNEHLVLIALKFLKYTKGLCAGSGLRAMGC